MSNKARKSMLVLSTLLVLSMLTGCMQMEVSLELYKDKTGSLSATAAVMEDFTEEGQAVIIADDKLGTIDPDTEGITVIQEDLSYGYQGVKYVGSKETVQFDNMVRSFQNQALYFSLKSGRWKENPELYLQKDVA